MARNRQSRPDYGSEAVGRGTAPAGWRARTETREAEMAAVQRNRHVKYSRGQILALSFRQKSLKRCKVSPLRSDAVGTLKAHRLLYHPTLGWRVTKKKKVGTSRLEGQDGAARGRETERVRHAHPSTHARASTLLSYMCHTVLYVPYSLNICAIFAVLYVPYSLDTPDNKGTHQRAGGPGRRRARQRGGARPPRPHTPVPRTPPAAPLAPRPASTRLVSFLHYSLHPSRWRGEMGVLLLTPRLPVHTVEHDPFIKSQLAST